MIFNTIIISSLYLCRNSFESFYYTVLGTQGSDVVYFFTTTTTRPSPASQASQVRRSAAENLGRLSGMSARVDALANDLVGNAQKAAVGVQVTVPYFQNILVTVSAVDNLDPQTADRLACSCPGFHL